MASLAAPPAQAEAPLVVMLSSGFETAWARQRAAVIEGLRTEGLVEGQGVRLEFHWADNDYNRLREKAAALMSLRPAVILASGGPVTAVALKQATATVPIVFTSVSYPVEAGLVASYARPGGNLTGVGGMLSELDAKRFELLGELVPGPRPFGALINARNPFAGLQERDLAAASRSIGRPFETLTIEGDGDLAEAFSRIATAGVAGLVVGADPGFFARRAEIIALAARHRLAAVYQWREFVDAGGLMSFGPVLTDAYRRSGVYAARIIKGANPADLPVLRPATFEFVFNLKAARALQLAPAPAFLARADEVIE